jgi:hypothetical protein
MHAMDKTYYLCQTLPKKDSLMSSYDDMCRLSFSDLSISFVNTNSQARLRIILLRHVSSFLLRCFTILCKYIQIARPVYASFILLSEDIKL